MKLTNRIATGNTAENYLHEGKIAKVYFREPLDAVENEARNQRYARSLGLPVPAVIELTEKDGRPMLVMERAPGVSMKDLMFAEPERMPEYLARSVEVQRSVHALAAPELRQMSDRLRQQIRSVESISDEQKSELVGTLGDVGEETQLCHGDFHVMNVMVDGDDVAIIDWMDATRGNRLLDACRTYVLYSEVDAAIAEAYLAEYCRQSGVGSEEVLRWESVMRGARMGEQATPT